MIEMRVREQNQIDMGKVFAKSGRGHQSFQTNRDRTHSDSAAFAQ